MSWLRSQISSKVKVFKPQGLAIPNKYIACLFTRVVMPSDLMFHYFEIVTSTIFIISLSEVFGSLLLSLSTLLLI